MPVLRVTSKFLQLKEVSVVLLKKKNTKEGEKCHSLSLPVVIVDDNETTVTTSKGNLVALVVPPVGLRLSIDHITENDHVPKKRLRQNFSELNKVLHPFHFLNWLCG